MDATRQIFVASTNKGKLRDFAAIAKAAHVDIYPIPNLGSLPEVEEDGDSFEENAIKKAVEYSRAIPGQIVIADDSGLAVAALNGAPGIYSARYASNGKGRVSDFANNSKLLAELAARPGAPRDAMFVCMIAAARDGLLLATFHGETEGEILQMEVGTGGFGYDPLFYLPKLNKTFAELSAEDKAALSHRGAAFRKFLEWLKSN